MYQSLLNLKASFSRNLMAAAFVMSQQSVPLNNCSAGMGMGIKPAAPTVCSMLYQLSHEGKFYCV